MNPRDIIKRAALDDDYRITRHALEEADKDGISTNMIEQVMLRSTLRKTEKFPGGVSRYTLYSRSQRMFISVELSPSDIPVVVTTGREK